MSRLLFVPISVGGGLVAGFVAKKLFDAAWSLIDEEEAPEPEQRNVQIGKLAAALALEGAAFRVTKGLIDHASRRGFERATGAWPGEDPEAETA
jgi:hypothetical protein